MYMSIYFYFFCYSPEGEYCKYCTLLAFTSSAITLPKENRFPWNWEWGKPNIGGWSWQILDAIRAVATV